MFLAMLDGIPGQQSTQQHSNIGVLQMPVPWTPADQTVQGGDMIGSGDSVQDSKELKSVQTAANT